MPAVVADEDYLTIMVDGVTIEGFPYENKLCPTCARQTYYNDVYDAIFCTECNVWIDSQCSDPDCTYFPGRPSRPLPIGH